MAKRYLSELHEALDDPNEIAEIQGKTFKLPLIIRQKDFKCAGLKISDCTFDSLTIGALNLQAGLVLENCTFNTSLDLQRITSESLSGDLNQKLQATIFIKGGYYKSLMIRNADIYSSITLEEVEALYIEGQQIKINSGDVSVKDCNIRGRLNFHDIEVSSTLRVSKTTVEKELHLEIIKANNLILQKSNFLSWSRIWGGALSKSMSIDRSDFSEDLIIQYVKATDATLTIVKSVFQDSCEISFFDGPQKKGDSGEISPIIETVEGTPQDEPSKLVVSPYLSDEMSGFAKIHIDSITLENGLSISGSSNLLLKYPLQKLYVNFTNRLKGEIKLSRFTADEVTLTGFNFSHIVFESFWIARLIFQDFLNFSTVQFFKLRSKPDNDVTDIVVDSSNLGRMELYNCKLDSFGSLTILDSQIAEIITAGVKWFKPQQLIIHDEEKWPKISSFELLYKNAERSAPSVQNAIRKREIYKQLKMAMQNQKDVIQALDFKAEEYRNYERELKLTRNVWNRDRIILMLSKTNNFGLNWWLPVLLSLGVTLIFYCLIIITISPSTSWSPATNWNEIDATCELLVNNFRVYFQLLNPTRLLGRVFPHLPETSGVIYFLDVFHRIIISFLIYQTIVAFRKYYKA